MPKNRHIFITTNKTVFTEFSIEKGNLDDKSQHFQEILLK